MEMFFVVGNNGGIYRNGRRRYQEILYIGILSGRRFAPIHNRRQGQKSFYLGFYPA
jgi:hypothetical protein